MGAGGRCNQDRIDILRRDDLFHACGLCPHRGRQIAGRLRHRIGHIGDLRHLGRADGGGVNFANPACAEYPEPDHFPLPNT